MINEKKRKVNRKAQIGFEETAVQKEELQMPN